MTTSTTTPQIDDRTSGQIIRDAIQDLHQQYQVATRELLCELTGLKMTIIDDHISRMIENGELRRLRAGVFAPIVPMPEPRAVSVTRMADGTSIIEIGDFVVHVYPRERRELASLLVGDAVQYSNIQAGVEAGTIATELAAELLATKREMGVQIQELKRQLHLAIKESFRGGPQMDLLNL